MALIKCKECGKEMSDTIKKCPNCGYKEKKKISKKTLIIIVVLLVAIIGGGITTGIIIHNNNIKQQEKAKKEYDDTLYITGAKMYVTGVVAEYHCSQIASVWHDCITSRYCSDFNSKINSYLTTNKKGLDKLNEYKDEISKNIQTLKNIPNSDYQDTYDKLVELYGVYTKLVEQATSPSGNYTNYISNYNSYSSDFKSIYDELKVLQPEIENYKDKVTDKN